MGTEPTSLTPEFVDAVLRRLAEAQREHQRHRPGPSERRQPVHTVYGGAHLFRADTAPRLGELARRAMDEHAPDAAALAAAVEIADPALAAAVHERVREKLEREPVEDFRIDFEDGYGTRPDVEEDGHAVAAAKAVATGLADGILPPFVGIRLKSLSAELARRSLRTLDLFVTTLLDATGGRLPPNFVVTLPKLSGPEPVRVLADALAELERRCGLLDRELRLELMVETPESVFAADGRIALPELVAAAHGRCAAAHFGTYDYTAALGITADHQQMSHPGCDFAKQVMQVALAGTGIWISDGATNVLPVAPHRAPDGGTLAPEEQAANRAVVYAAWRLHAADVRHSLEQAFYQGWDLHPAQLVSRYATVYAFFLAGVDAASERLRNFIAKAAQATLVGDVFDDAATGQGLLNYFLRAINCGALAEAEVEARTGLTHDELALRSFARILAGRVAG
jgi:citrate lyase beta subunit